MDDTDLLHTLYMQVGESMKAFYTLSVAERDALISRISELNVMKDGDDALPPR